MLELINTQFKENYKSDIILHTFFELYGSKLVELYTELFKQEDIYGRSSNQYNILQYFISFQYIALLKNEYTRDKKEFKYYIDKYEVDRYNKIFRCVGIDLSRIFKIFELPEISDFTNGINKVSVENSFTVENIHYFNENLSDKSEINILNLTTINKNYLTSICPECCKGIIIEEIEENTSGHLLWQDDNINEFGIITTQVPEHILY